MFVSVLASLCRHERCISITTRGVVRNGSSSSSSNNKSSPSSNLI